MSDQRRQARDDRQKAEAYSRVMEQGLSDYGNAVEHRKTLEKLLTFTISDAETLHCALGEVAAMWEAMSECIPQAIRVEFEARRVTRNEEITGGRVM